MDYLFIFIFQICFNFMKVFEIKYSYNNNTWPLILVSAILSGLTLASFFLSFKLLLTGNFLVIVVFILGSVIGKLLAVLVNKRI